MATPAVVLVAGLVAAPLALALVYSFTDWRGSGFDANFVGFENYSRLLGAPEFTRAVGVTLFIAVVTTLALNVLGLALAVLLTRAGVGSSIYRSIFFFPMVLSPLIVGFLWRTLLDYGGVVNNTITGLGFDRIEFLGKPDNALWSVTFVIVWQSVGFNMVLYIAGLQNIPRSLLDAAQLDGAGPWRTFSSVTLPLLAPVITVNVVSVFIFNMREYDRIRAVTDGGPGGATQTLAYKIIAEGFNLGFLGRGSAYSVILMISVGLVAALLVVLLRRREAALR
jgi:multiple sugar transport system permease protein/raffinose/stachyose/melibiose transport system permease protein